MRRRGHWWLEGKVGGNGKEALVKLDGWVDEGEAVNGWEWNAVGKDEVENHLDARQQGVEQALWVGERRRWAKTTDRKRQRVSENGNMDADKQL